MEIIDAEMNFDQYALLVGANNAGKSTIIDSIRAFYEKDGFKFKKENDLPFKGKLDEESWIELTFLLNEEENNSLAEEYKTLKRCLKVRKYFLTTRKMHDGKNASGSIFGYKTDGTLSEEPFYGAKNVQNGKFGFLIYIPAISKVDEHTKLSGPSALRDLISNIMSNVVEGSDAYKTFDNSVSAFSSCVREIKTEDNQSLSSFEEELNALLYPWQTKFNLHLKTPSATEMIKSMVSWDIQDKQYEKAQNIECFGSGFQRHFIYSLIQLGAKLTAQKTQKKNKDFTPSFSLVLFEEPEAFLHPPQQDDLARNLMTLSESSGWQIICSTHSPHFVSRNTDKISSIIRVQRCEGIIKTFQIGTKEWRNIVDSNQSIQIIADKHPKDLKLTADDRTPEMDAIKYYMWLNPDRAGMFFAQHVLLVEGPSETALINRLRDDNYLTLPSGIYVLDCLGKYNIHRFMNLLTLLGVYHSVIFDDDENRNKHKDLNQLILDSKDPTYTIAVVSLPKDLESVLDIPPPDGLHKKPQHILYLYAQEKINDKNLKDFCNKLEECFPSQRGL